MTSVDEKERSYKQIGDYPQCDSSEICRVEVGYASPNSDEKKIIDVYTMKG